MNIKIVGRTIGRVILMECLFMLPALIWCLIDREYDVLGAYGLTILIMLATAGLLLLTGRGARETFFAQEGFVTVALCWVAISVMGCLPFYLSGQIPHFIDALFESISGFTTTGASILPDVEALSRGLLYWRSFTHWLGGMGILVFALAVVSDKNAGGAFHACGKPRAQRRQTDPAAERHSRHLIWHLLCNDHPVPDFPVARRHAAV